MTSNSQKPLAWIFSIVGLASAGFAAGLHRLVWGLYWVVAVIWCLFIWWLASQSHHGDQLMYWISALGPTLVVGIVLKIVEGVVLAIFGGVKELADAAAQTSRHPESHQK